MVRYLHRAYKLCLAPFLGERCRFHPSCSDFALEAFETHGIFKGFWLSLRRIVRCQPWCEGGFDPVPPAR